VLSNSLTIEQPSPPYEAQSLSVLLLTNQQTKNELTASPMTIIINPVSQSKIINTINSDVYLQKPKPNINIWKA